MTFDDALTLIASRFHLDADALKAFAAEDPHDGFDGGAGSWPCGSLWTVEGCILYALTRALQPKIVVELGSLAGCSTTHLAAALQMNGNGKVISVDHVAGSAARVPLPLEPYVERIATDGIRYVNEHLPPNATLVFEDMMHSAEEVTAVWRAALDTLPVGAMMISHDSEHATAGAEVRRGIANAGVVNVLSLLVEPSDCGLAMTRKS